MIAAAAMMMRGMGIWDLVTWGLGGLWNGDFRTGVGTWGHEHPAD